MSLNGIAYDSSVMHLSYSVPIPEDDSKSSCMASRVVSDRP